MQSLSEIEWQKDAKTYLHIAYLLLSFPLGLIYFVVLIVGIAVGVGTLVIWIGAVILLLLLHSVWYIASFERYLAQRMLHITLPELLYPGGQERSFWQRQLAVIKNSLTWKIQLYLFLKFPLGLISFVVTLVFCVIGVVLVMVSTVVGLSFAPFVLLGMVILDASRVKERFQQYMGFCMMGCGVMWLILVLLNQLAVLHANFARLMLARSENEQRLYEAQQQVLQERARAEQAEQRRHELVINVSHELRAPVASIMGHLESLLIVTEKGKTPPSPAELSNYLTIAHQEAKNLGTLVDELLSLARMESNALTMNMQAVAIRDVVEDIYRVMHPLAQQQRQIALVRGYGQDLQSVYGDPQRLRQILVNLVRNAITYTPAGGIVSITVERSQDQAAIEVKVEDNGVGIAEEHLPHLFERFYRVDGSRTRATGGTGLGLAIVHDFITGMGGSIQVSSVEGQGSCFTVSLPMATHTAIL